MNTFTKLFNQEGQLLGYRKSNNKKRVFFTDIDASKSMLHKTKENAKD